MTEGFTKRFAILLALPRENNMAQYLKIQEEVKAAGITAAPSYLLPLNDIQAQKAKEFIATLD